MSIILPHIQPTIDGENRATDIVSYELEQNRVIYLTGPINSDLYSVIAPALRYLDRKSRKDICLFINSPGGSVSDGLAIYDLMQESRCDIVTVAIGLAASMASFLLAAGTKGKRYALKNAKIMLHQPSGGAEGQATDISIAAERILQTKKELAACYASFCHRNLKTVLRDMERDCWLGSEEALRYGLIDHVGLSGGLKI